MHGHADVREFLEALWRAIPDMTFELLDGPYVIPGEARASFHWRGFGTFTGPMDPPGFAPTGRRWEVDGADFHEYRDGRIGKLRVAFDVMTVARQLGVMPAAGSRGERAMAAAQRGVTRAQQEYQRLRAR
jgi:predicted ester cyclase